MILIVQSFLRAVEGRLRDGAQHLLLWMGFCLSLWLIGMAGIGFVIASAFLALASLMGAGWAAGLVGLALIALVGGLWVLATGREAKASPAVAPPAPPTAASAEASTVAFTAAFVLGRYLNRDNKGDDWPR